MLLLLQNRGRMNSRQLADELEVTRRTILRDVDAMTEAGLPIVVHRGNQGGIELGFNYRTRLTGLSSDEAEALGVILSHPMSALDTLGMRGAAEAARGKLLESLPDGVREKAALATRRFRVSPDVEVLDDPRIAAFAKAIRGANIVTIRSRSKAPRRVHPVAMVLFGTSVSIIDDRRPDDPISLSDCDDINISAKRFGPVRARAS